MRTARRVLCAFATAILLLPGSPLAAAPQAQGFDLEAAVRQSLRRIPAEAWLEAARASGAAALRQNLERRQERGERAAAEGVIPGPWAEALPSPQEEASPGLLVFLDCNRRTCDQDYLRREITFINYVRDRQDAQIQILVTRQRAGAGEEFTFDFIGLKEFEGDETRHSFVSSQTDTEDERRESIAQMIRVGVLHYLASTPMIRDIEIRAQASTIEDRFLVVDPADDPWNFWVFRLNLNGELGGEDRRTDRQLRANVSANRTTEEYKFRFNLNYRFDSRKVVLNDGSESRAENTNWSFAHQTVKTLGDRWGASVKASVIQATFVNIRKVAMVAPGIEYNFFPYSESSRRRFTLTYEVGLGHYDYFEPTLFLFEQETLFDHTLLANLDAVQPWGEVEGGIQLAQFLGNLQQWRAVLEGGIEFRLFRGLTFNVGGEWAAIRDQRYLPGEAQTNEEILLRQRALATNSRYEFSIGLTYTFGSIFNNVVNPRFANNRGDFNRFF